MEAQTQDTEPAEQRITALIIEDERILRELIRHALETLNCEVIDAVEDGQTGIDVYRREKPDLVLLDIIMPNMDGVTVLTAIREHDPDAYVVMLTAVEEGDIIEDCMIAGARDYIRKTDPADTIAKRLGRHVTRLREPAGDA